MILRRLLVLLGAAGLVAAGGALGLWLYVRLIFGFTLEDQPGQVLFPPECIVNASATNRVAIKLNGYINATVPFRQTLNLPLHGDYDADIVLDTQVPIRFTVHYSGVIPVDTYAAIAGRTDFNYQNVKRFRNVAFTTRIPLRFRQPVSFTVPVDTSIHFVYRGPLKVRFDQTVNAPVDTVLHTRIEATREISTPILARFGLRVRWPRTAVPMIIQHADLRLALDSLRLRRAADPAQPVRGEAPRPGSSESATIAPGTSP